MGGFNVEHQIEIFRGESFIQKYHPGQNQVSICVKTSR